MQWKPLSSVWDAYSSSLETARDTGVMDDPEAFKDVVWPSDLNFGDMEQEDVEDFIHSRVNELIYRFQMEQGINPTLLANYLFRSMLAGMLWERERIG